ncbi:MAG: SUMF1/EgtB/PvdO family nonheme iron enzyme [Polyangiaceae bacterium]|nr:SUMF1/EgtB/PvdO family nonheme iron enzyme [Polyangiaceae bacterium]
MGDSRALTLAAIGLLGGCTPRGPEPYGEVLLNVDTDLPVPRVVSQLRVDLYSEDGRWFESRSIGLPDPTSWPVSFSVYSADESQVARTWVRLRAHSDGAERDYRGERFTDQGVVDPVPEAEGPRLVRAGVDVTPLTEPLPALSVDRLFEVSLEPGRRETIDVLLEGECSGSMSRLSAPRTTCFAGNRVTVGDLSGTLGISRATASKVGSWSEPCPNAGDADRVCIPGGASIMGSRELLLFPDKAPSPERVVYLSRLWVDRHEVSVGRFRAAIAAGFAPEAMPAENPGALGPDYVKNGCTWQSVPGDREAFALSCVSQKTARAFCQFVGGNLPTEAEWEYVATSAGRDRRTPFPWGESAPACEAAVFGRLSLAGSPGVCEASGLGPLPADAGEGDRSPLGVHGLAGGVSEWVLDSYEEYSASCWRQAKVADPQCQTATTQRALRGGSWAAPPTVLRSAARMGAEADGQAAFIGFRCVYREPS